MIRGVLTLAALVSVVLFPWPSAVLLALVAAPIEPFVPLAAGIFADTLYVSPPAILPIFTLCGLFVTTLTFFVRSRLSAGTMGR